MILKPKPYRLPSNELLVKGDNQQNWVDKLDTERTKPPSSFVSSVAKKEVKIKKQELRVALFFRVSTRILRQ